MLFAEATKVSHVNRVPPHLCLTGLSLHRTSLYSPCQSVHKDIGADNDLITFTADKTFGLVNIVQRRPERNTTVDIDGEVLESCHPQHQFVVTRIKITAKISAGQLEDSTVPGWEARQLEDVVEEVNSLVSFHDLSLVTCQISSLLKHSETNGLLSLQTILKMMYSRAAEMSVLLSEVIRQPSG